MTSHTLASFRSTSIDPSITDSQEIDCPFCQIVSGLLPAYIVYQDVCTIAFLDILPIRKGHTLVLPKHHTSVLSEVKGEEATAIATTLVKVVRGIARALEDDRLQVITNQKYAQIVPHVHFHVVPAPSLLSQSTSTSTSTSTATADAHKLAEENGKGRSQSFKTKVNPLTLFGHGREELDDEQAVELAQRIREGIRKSEEERQAQQQQQRTGEAKL